MGEELTWERLKALAAAERLAREALEKAVAQSGGSAEMTLRLARACVRDHRLVEALAHYDRAEALGHPEAPAERRLLAQRVGDFPEREDGSHA
ncbi:MAG TPA: hypothetical protein VFB38_21685 [Chthonomonadaceae bacterium]|nr:hypothetical protein [Chthonomonadaceae bacterium]